MNEHEIDKAYLDDKFVNVVNNLENEKFGEFVNLLVENFENDLSHQKISNFSKFFSTSIIEIDSTKFLRQLKYLVNKGTYNRLSKKYKQDLLRIHMNEDKIDIMIEIQRVYFENFNLINKREGEMLKNIILKDFEIKTEMPICNTNYNVKSNFSLNEDIKKQNLIVNLNLLSSENFTNLVVQIDKSQLINMYEEIEKIQEKLDKLY